MLNTFLFIQRTEQVLIELDISAIEKYVIIIKQTIIYLSKFYFVMHINLVRVKILTNKILKTRGVWSCAHCQFWHCTQVSHECSPKMCTTNNAMPFFVTLTVIVHLQYYCIFSFLNNFVHVLYRFQSPSVAMSVISANVEGLKAGKASILSVMCKEQQYHFIKVEKLAIVIPKSLTFNNCVI